MIAIVIYIYCIYKKKIFSKRFYIQKKQKTYPFYVSIFFKAQILRALLSNKNVFVRLWKKPKIQ